jgi:hypothetical protein
MSREEELEQAASFYQLSNSQEKFIEGAKWADQNPREGLWDATKVIRWLKEHISEYYMTNEFEECFDSMYEDLKKAMEE